MVPVRKFEFDCGLLFCLWISCSCGGNKNCPNGFSPISNNLLLPDFGFLPLSMQMLPSCWFQGIESESVFPSVTYSLFPKLFSFYSLLSSCFLNSLGNRISWVFFLLLCLSRVLLSQSACPCGFNIYLGNDGGSKPLNCWLIWSHEPYWRLILTD